ncbi:hypothetical protein CsSME_00005537 [Camellia sinensis var. sinensis]
MFRSTFQTIWWMCPQGQWEKLVEGSWVRSMSPFDHKLLDQIFSLLLQQCDGCWDHPCDIGDPFSDMKDHREQKRRLGEVSKIPISFCTDNQTLTKRSGCGRCGWRVCLTVLFFRLGWVLSPPLLAKIIAFGSYRDGNQRRHN